MPRRSAPRRRAAMIDLILGYSCNARCVFCTAGDDLRTVTMSSGEAEERLTAAIRAHRPRKVRFGGGEPTLRSDLGSLVGRARAEGVPAVSVQTNGFRFSSAPYTAQLARCGLGKVNLSVKAMSGDLYDRLTGTRGGLGLVEQAARNILGAGLALELDILLVTPILDEIETLTAC